MGRQAAPGDLAAGQLSAAVRGNSNLTSPPSSFSLAHRGTNPERMTCALLKFGGESELRVLYMFLFTSSS